MKDSEINTNVMQCLKQQQKAMCNENIELCEDKSFVIETIDKDSLDTNSIQESLPKGRNIVDISFMWNEIHRTFDNHARGIECQFKV
jgi:hypothetical protein